MKREIKYDDYVALGWNAVPEEFQVDFLAYFKFLLDSDFRDLEEHLKTRLELKRFPKRSDKELLEGILAQSFNDLTKKRSNKNYYHCNAICLIRVLRKIFTADLYSCLTNPMLPKIVLDNYEHILKSILLDADDLCNLYDNNIKGDNTYHSSIDVRYVHSMSVHQVLRQSLFGQASFNSFADMEISASIAVIRQLVEFRLRRAFGVLAYIDEEKNLLPLDLSSIIDCLKKHREEIDFPIPLENIEQIYQWSNLYIHSGKQDYSWIPYFVEEQLRTFSFGVQKENGWAANNGIAATEKAIQEIHQELIGQLNKPNVNTCGCRPECEIRQQSGQESE